MEDNSKKNNTNGDDFFDALDGQEPVRPRRRSTLHTDRTLQAEAGRAAQASAAAAAQAGINRSAQAGTGASSNQAKASSARKVDDFLDDGYDPDFDGPADFDGSASFSDSDAFGGANDFSGSGKDAFDFTGANDDFDFTEDSYTDDSYTDDSYTDENGLDLDFDYNPAAEPEPSGSRQNSSANSSAADTGRRESTGKQPSGSSRSNDSRSKDNRSNESRSNDSRSKDSRSKDTTSQTHAGHEKKARELNSASTAIDAQTLKEAQAQKKKSRTKKIIFWAVLECLTLAVIFVYGYFLRAWNLISRPEVNEENIENNNISLEKKQEMEQGWWTVAVFGVDGRSSSDLVSKGLNSDVIIIASINQDNGDIRLCNVFRDTYLNISKDDDELYRKINAAYCNGGPEQALAALNKNLDLNIKNYVTFNWKAVADGINILGGIDGIDISKAEYYYINAFITETVQVTKIGSHQLANGPGTYHLDGVQAVAYGRLRLMDSDYARVERQKKVIKACFEKAKQSSFSVLNNIMVVCFPEVATNINFNEVVAMAQNITKYNIADTGGFPWMRSETANSKIGDVIVPATLESNVIKLHEFLYDDADYQPSSACLHYSETIKEKTGIYKEGQVIESVRTDGGLISTPKPAATEESKETGEGEEGSVQIAETDAEGNIIEKATIGVDSNGNYVYPTNADGEIEIPRDSSGNVLYPTDEYGNIIYETDADGNVVNPTNADGSPYTTEETRPSETVEDGDEDGPVVESSHADDEESYGPGGTTTKPSETRSGPGSSTTTAGTTAYNGPGSETKESTETSTTKATESATGSKPTGIVDDGGSTGPGSSSDSSAPGSSTGPGSSGSSSSSGAPGSETTASSDGPVISTGTAPG